MPAASLALVTTISPLSLPGRDWGLNIDLGPHRPRHTCYSLLSSLLSPPLPSLPGLLAGTLTDRRSERALREMMRWQVELEIFPWLCPPCLTEWQSEATVQLCTVYAHLFAASLSGLQTAGCLSSSQASPAQRPQMSYWQSYFDNRLNLRIWSRWRSQQHQKPVIFQMLRNCSKFQFLVEWMMIGGAVFSVYEDVVSVNLLNLLRNK